MRKITPEQMADMVKLRGEGITLQEIGNMFGVVRSTVLHHTTPYRAKYLSEHNRSMKKYYTEHRDEHNEYWKKRRSEHHYEFSEAQKKLHAKQRACVLTLLGSKCLRCGITDTRILQINYINGGHRKDLKKYVNNSNLYKAIMKGERGISDLNLLCANHNSIYEYETGRRPLPENTAKLRLAAVKLLGEKCEKCGIINIRVLQIHHMSGNGEEDREKYKDARTFYRAIINGERSASDLNLLCANCHILCKYENAKEKLWKTLEEQ